MWKLLRLIPVRGEPAGEGRDLGVDEEWERMARDDSEMGEEAGGRGTGRGWGCERKQRRKK